MVSGGSLLGLGRRREQNRHGEKSHRGQTRALHAILGDEFVAVPKRGA
jgi:hypothetical protein